jgi:hypothetical protein
MFNIKDSVQIGSPPRDDGLSGNETKEVGSKLSNPLFDCLKLALYNRGIIEMSLEVAEKATKLE